MFAAFVNSFLLIFLLLRCRKAKSGCLLSLKEEQQFIQYVSLLFILNPWCSWLWLVLLDCTYLMNFWLYDIYPLLCYQFVSFLLLISYTVNYLQFGLLIRMQHMHNLVCKHFILWWFLLVTSALGCLKTLWSFSFKEEHINKGGRTRS